MLQVDYKDILSCREIAYSCYCGELKGIEIINVPADVHVNERMFSTGVDREKISYLISYIRTENKVTVVPQTKADTLSKCMLLKNNLLLLPINDKDFLLRLRVKCSDDSVDYDKFMLVLDLGNTRTCALTCTTLWDPSAAHQWKTHPLSFEPLTMRLNYKKSNTEFCDSIFSSKCVLGTNVHQDWTRSFVQLDKNANLPTPEVVDSDLRWCLSGPKRYFWQDDTLRIDDDYKSFSWATSKLHYLHPADSSVGQEKNDFVSGNLNESYEYNLSPLNLPIAQAMTHRSFAVNDAERQKAFQKGVLPYSIFLKGMLWELMEQAELQVNRKRKTLRPFRLSDLVVTFPAVWTTAEKEAYAKQIRETADLYAQQRCFDHARECKINVDISCDEGMAVFTTYLCSEYNKKRAAELIGKKVAVIDIGGGTSDLVIAEIESEKNEILNTRYVVQSVYSNGTYEAGDKFIHSLVETILVPSVIKKLFPAINKTTFNTVLDILSDVITSNNDPVGKEALKSFVYSLWYPAALELLSIFNNRNKVNNNLFHLKHERQQYLNEFCDIIERHKNFASLGLVGEKFTLSEGFGEEGTGEVELQLLNDNFEAVSRESFKEQMSIAVERTFSATLRSFGDIIKKYDCSHVLLSGKISDLDIVREIFRKQLADGIILIGMNEYDYENMPTKDYIAGDSKYATVTGAGIYRMAKTGRLKGVDLQIKEPVATEFIWGLYRDQQFYSFDEVEPVAAISSEKLPIYIARKSSNEAPWIPSYELRPVPWKNVTIEKTMKFQFDSHSLNPRWLSGCFSLDGRTYELENGKTLSKEQQAAFDEAFEFRICKLMPEENSKSNILSWLDSGMVFHHNNEEKE